MSNKSRETTVLRPSLKKQPAQAQARSRDSDAKRHVTFATPKLPSSKCNLPKQHSASDQSISKKQKSVVDTHRKRIPSVQLVELRAKKNKHNEQIVRLCEAQEALVKSDYVIRRMGKKAKEHEAAAAALLQNAVSLIEIDVLRSFEKQRIEDLLDSVEQQQQKAKQELHEELAGFNERIDNIGKKNKTKSGDVIAEPETDKAIMELESVDEGVLAKILVSKGALATIEKCNEMLDVQLTSTEDERDLSVVEEMKLLSADVSLYLDVLDSLKQFHL